MGSRAAATVRLGKQTVELGPSNPRAVLGRDEATCDLVTVMPAVSRRHAEIALFGKDPHIRDLGSANGTWVDGEPVGTEWVRLRPMQSVHLGEEPLEVEWAGGGGSTTMEIASKSLIQRIDERQVAREAAAQAPLSPEKTINLSAVAEMPYRWEGENVNGRLLLALSGDLIDSDSMVDGAATFMAFDDARVSSILVELVEISPGTRARGRVWDRALVFEGPWRAEPSQRVSGQFRLELPPIATPTAPRVIWEVRGLVELDWAKDVKVKCPVSVRNLAFENLFEGWAAVGGLLGALDPEEAGVRYRAGVSLRGASRTAGRTGQIRFEVLVSGDSLRLAFVSKRLLGSDRRAEVRLPRKTVRSMAPEALGQELIEGLLQMG